MNHRRDGAGLLFVAFVLVLLGPVGDAFACTALATLNLSPNAGNAGSTTTASGRYFRSTPIEIRWNSMTGPVIATATGPSFDTRVPIPGDATPGVHSIIAISRLEGEETYRAVASFKVTEPPTTTTTAPMAQSSPQAQSPPGGSNSPPPADEPSAESGSAPPAAQPRSGNTPPPNSQSVTGPSSAGASPTTTKAAGAVTTRTTSGAAATGASPTTTAAAVIETSTPPTSEDAATSSTTEPDDDRELAVQPSASRTGWGPAQVVAVFVLGGLLALGGAAMGRRGRQPKP